MSSLLRVAFETKAPDITASERTKNLRAKTVYTSMLKTAKTCPNSAGENYTGTMKFDISGNVTNYRSYELASIMARGAAFQWDNCCKGLGAQSLNVNGEPCAEDWGAKGMELYNLNGSTFRWSDMNVESPRGMKYYDGTTGSNPWVYDELDNAGDGGTFGGHTGPGGTLDGSGVWIDPSSNLFGTFHDCEIDKWKEGDRIHPKYRYISGNNSKNNYLVAYQAMGRRYNLKKWNLRFTPIMYQLDCSGTIVWRGRPGDCCPPFLGLTGPTGPPLP